MANWQRYSLGVGALLAWIVLMAVSITANITFAISLGHSEIEKIVLGGMSVASDVMKAVSPLAFLYFVATRRWTAAVATFGIGLVTVAFALMAATGFVAGERYRAFYAAEDAKQRTVELREDIEESKSQRGWVPTHEPASVIQAKVVAMEGDSRFKDTNGCTAAKGRLEEWCRGYRQLGVELAAAVEAKNQDAEMEQKREELKRDSRSYGDAQIEFIKGWFGGKETDILSWLVILTVVLIESGSAFGLTVALGLLTSEATAFGRRIHEALDVVKPKSKAPPLADTEPPGKPRVPDAASVPSFTEPATAKPEGVGFRDKLTPVVLPKKRTASAA